MLAGQQRKENWQILFKRVSFVLIQVVVEAPAMTFVGMSFQAEPIQFYMCRQRDTAQFIKFMTF